MRNLTAVIEFSLINIQYIIAQKIGEEIKVLESASFPIEFYKISDNKERLKEINRVCNILLEIKRDIKTYGINARSIKFFAGDNLKELKNKEFIKEQIRIKTGFSLEILDSSKESIFLYKKMLNLYGESLKKELSMFLFMAYDKISFYILSKGRVLYYQSISITPIKLKEILNELSLNPENTEIVIEEYLKNYFDMFKNFLPGKIPYNLFIISEKFSDVLGNKKNSSKEIIEKIEKILSLSDIKIKKEYRLDDDALRFFREKLLMARATIKSSKVPNVFPINYSLINTILHNSFFIGTRRKFDTEVKISTLKSCEYISKRYLNDEAHASNVKTYGRMIFNELAKLHQLTTRDLLILEGASILHDIGKFVNLREHYKISYDLINNSSIFGYSEEEQKKVAILSYFHSKKEPSLDHRFFSQYSDSDKIRLIKLCAILRVADALDRSHKQNIKNIIIKISDNQMTFDVPIIEEPLIERWAFEKKSGLFSEVFGLNLKLNLRR